MGGYGSGGCRGKPARYVEDYQRLDIVRMFRHCYSLMRHGFRCNHTDYGPFEDEWNGIFFCYNNATGLLNIRRPGRQTVCIEMLPMLGNGVLRPYVLCPCGRRCSSLFLVNGEYACRQCHGLIYRQQGQGRQDRARTTAFRIRERLDNQGGIGDALLRPKNMHNRTYEKWQKRCVRAEHEVMYFMPASLRKYLPKAGCKVLVDGL